MSCKSGGDCPYTQLDASQGYDTDCTYCEYWEESDSN